MIRELAEFEFIPDPDFEGGDDDDFQPSKKPMTKEEKKLAKYQGDMDNFSVEGNSRITNGCVTDRPCRDVLCLLVFLACLSAMLAATLYGHKHGQVHKYMAPLDKKDNFCGFSAGYETTQKLYFTSLFGTPVEILKSGVCVEKCPSLNGEALVCSAADQAQCKELTKTHESFDIFNFCIPNLVALKAEGGPEYEAWMALLKEFGNDPIGQKIKDLYYSSRAIYWSIGLSLVYSLLYIYLMSLVAEYIAWLMIAMVQLALFAVAAYLYNVYEY